jgi:hypothetical protein
VKILTRRNLGQNFTYSADIFPLEARDLGLENGSESECQSSCVGSDTIPGMGCVAYVYMFNTNSCSLYYGATRRKLNSERRPKSVRGLTPQNEVLYAKTSTSHTKCVEEKSKYIVIAVMIKN